MQINAGWAKGLNLKAPAGLATRPTGAKVRAAILNSLQPFLDDALVLDLFSGSGALGIEALSRGARGAVFVESAAPAVKCLKENLAEMERRATRQDLKLEVVRVVARGALEALKTLGDLTPFDIVCMDPPYRDAASWFQKLARPLAELCGDDARWIVESGELDFDALLAAEPAGFPWVLARQKQYGETLVTTWEKLAAGGRDPDGLEESGTDGDDQ